MKSLLHLILLGALVLQSMLPALPALAQKREETGLSHLASLRCAAAG